MSSGAGAFDSRSQSSLSGAENQKSMPPINKPKINESLSNDLPSYDDILSSRSVSKLLFI